MIISAGHHGGLNERVDSHSGNVNNHGQDSRWPTNGKEKDRTHAGHHPGDNSNAIYVVKPCHKSPLDKKWSKQWHHDSDEPAKVLFRSHAQTDDLWTPEVT